MRKGRFKRKNTVSSRAWERALAIDRETLAEFCQKYYIKHLAIFGSALRDDFRPDSDVDVLVDFMPGHLPGLDFIAIERELSGLLQGRPVDMVTPNS